MLIISTSFAAAVGPPNLPLQFRRRQSHNLRAVAAQTRTHLSSLSLLLSRRAPELESENEIPFTRLRRLLASPSPSPSPRGAISHRWRDLHGLSSEWASLLDPLDPDLRRELLRYGDFIHSAYHAFLNPVRQVPLPDPAYRLTRHLYATPSLLPSPRSSWIGFVSVCDSEAEIRRMGRRDILVALRGTATLLEWAENLRANLVPLLAGRPPKVGCGFRSLFATAGRHLPSLSAAVSSEVARLASLYRGEDLSVTIAGHSLGAALALLAAHEISASPAAPPVTVFSFGGPRTGNSAFADALRRHGVRVLRVVNPHDLVTRIPAAGDARRPPWRWWGGYEHVGKELTVDSRLSPFLRPDPDLACCHDLEAYLHLVDGLGGDRASQFRPNASRGLARLLAHQRPNVKKLYLNKAALLGLDPHTPPNHTRFSSWFPTPSS